jgi:glycosyltransferase involved in cell wall biosynthesis
LIRRGHSITVLTSSAKMERDFWQAAPSSAVISEIPQENLHIIRCPLKPIPGGRSALLLWRKMMVLLSMLPGDQSRPLMHFARRIPTIPDLEPTLNNLDQRFDIVQAFNLSWEYPLTVGRGYAQCHNLALAVIPYTHFGVAGQDRVARNSTMDHQLKILNQAQAVLTLTTIEEEGLVDLGLKPERVTTIHGGLDQAVLPDNPADILKQVNISPPFALFLGRVSFDKGAVHAARAICHHNRQYNPLTLILAGQPTPEFERVYQKFSPEEKEWVRPIGLISEPQKQALLANTEMLLLPSRTDSFGIVILEAWAYGKAVIGANAGGIPGVIDNGRNGLLIEFGDVPALSNAINELIENPAQKESLGRAGLEKVNTLYRWDTVGQRVEAVYHRIVQP